MENPQLREPSLPNEDRKQTSRKFKGIRQREWGSWLAEIRMPKSRQKIYLGSYKTAEQAARAFDAAMYCLRGPNAKFNFPDSVPAIPSTSSLSRQQIQVAATKYALNELPFAAPSLDHNIDNNSKEEPSQSSSVSEMELSSDEREISEEMAFWKSLFWRSEGAECLNLEKIPSIDEALALELALTSQEEEIDISVDPTALWNFENDFVSDDSIFCGVFDGHGPYGHLVARRVRDSLPMKLHSFWQSFKDKANNINATDTYNNKKKAKNGQNDLGGDGQGSSTKESSLFSAWKDTYLKAYKVMDKELRSRPTIDCFCSGSTAVAVVKQGDYLFIGNIGDSRAVLVSNVLKEKAGTADFLQEVTSKKDQEQYWAAKRRPYHYVPVKEFVFRFKYFNVGLDSQNELSVAYAKNRGHRAALVFNRNPVPKIEIFKACFSKEWLLVKRNSFVYIFKTVQIMIVAFIGATVFLRTKMHHKTSSDANLYLGALFFSLPIFESTNPQFKQNRGILRTWELGKHRAVPE